MCFALSHQKQLLSGQTMGGAVLVHKNGLLDLLGSVFENNWDDKLSDLSGVGIVNLGGEIDCDDDGCFPVCDVCLDDDEVLSPGPAPQPARPKTNGTDTRSRWWFVTGSVIGGLVACSATLFFSCRRSVTCQFRNSDQRDTPGLELPVEQALQQRLLLEDKQPDGSVQLALRSVVKCSPAPIFVVSCDMRISAWSPGMDIAAPILVNPIGALLLDLPFVNTRDGARLQQILGKIFEDQTETEHENAQTFMLHLFTKNGNVLLEMVANSFFAESELVVVMTGREVDLRLVGLLSHERAVGAAREDKNSDTADSCEDEMPLHSASDVGCSFEGDDVDGGEYHSPRNMPQVNNGKDDGLFFEVESSVSSVTLPSCLSSVQDGSTISSLTSCSEITKYREITKYHLLLRR